MTNQFPPLSQLSKPQLEELMNACVNFDAGNILGPEHKDSEVTSYSSPKFGWEWKTKKEFETDIKVITGKGSIIEANKVLEQKFAQAPEKEGEDVPSQAKRAVQKEELEQRTAAKEAADQKAKEDTKKFLDQEKKRAERLKEILKNKKVWVKVEEAKVEKNAQTENLKEQAQAKPKKFVTDSIEVLEESPTVKNRTPEEKEVAVKQAAVTTYEVVSGSSPIVQAAIINRVVSDPKVLETIIPDKEARTTLRSVAEIVSDTKTSQYELSKQLVDLGKIGGYKDAESIRVELSDVPLVGYREIDLNQQITIPYLEGLGRQEAVLGELKEVTEGQVQSILLRSAGGWLDGQIASLPAESALSQTYNSSVVKLGLQSLGVAQTSSWVAVGGSFAGKLIVGSGYGPLAGALQQFTGVSLGVAKAAVPAAAAGAVGGEVTGAAVGAAFPVPGLNLALAAAGAAIGKVLSTYGPRIKKWLEENSKFFLLGGLMLGGAGLLTGSNVLAGVGATSAVIGGASALSAGAGLGTIGTTIGNFFLALGGAALGAVGIPILVTLLTFPVVVALILFIINSGAYIVPPSLSSLNLGGFDSPYVDVAKTVSPDDTFENSVFNTGEKEITYTIKITPKKGDLKNVMLSYDCEVVSKTPRDCPEIVIEDKYKDIFTKPIDISATGISFTYTSKYGSGFRDSSVIDYIKLSGFTSDDKAVQTETSASVTFGNAPISCPVIGGHAATPSMNYSYNSSNNSGHGSSVYWNTLERFGTVPYSYPIPQSTSCNRPSDCPYYGYAYDIFPTGSSEVFAPTIKGQDVTWNCSYAFANPGAGNTYHCISTNGDYMLSLTHMAGGARTGNIKSGQSIGKLYFQPGNTHLHIEFQLKGRYVKPEQYFCGGK